MTIQIEEIKTSVYTLSNDWSEGDFAEGLHLVLRCEHDNIFYDKETRDMWCPDCFNEHLSTDDRLELLEHHFEGEQE